MLSKMLAIKIASKIYMLNYMANSKGKQELTVLNYLPAGFVKI